MKIRKNKALAAAGIYFFLLFALTLDFRVSLFKNIYFAYVFAGIAILFIYVGSKTHFSKKIPFVLVLWLISILWVLYTLNINYIIKYMIGLILLYTYYKKGGAGIYTVKGLVIFGTIFAFFTFWFYFKPSIYVSVIVPKLSTYLQDTAVSMVRTNRFPGLTGHYSTNGIYLSMGFGAMTALYLSNPRQLRKKGFVLLSLVLTLGALLLIGKRAHLVFSVASAFGLYWLYNAENRKNRFVKIVSVFVIVSILFVIFVNQIPELANTFNRFTETAESGDFLMSRGTFYVEALSQFRLHPFIGCGWRTLMDVMNHDAHNIYIQLLAETGIIGFVLYSALLIFGIYMSVFLLRKVSTGKLKLKRNDLTMLLFSAFYIFFFILYGFTGNPLYDEQTFYILMIAYGALLYFYYQIRSENYE